VELREFVNVILNDPGEPHITAAIWPWHGAASSLDLKTVRVLSQCCLAGADTIRIFATSLSTEN